jgi:hypothetical protein
MKTIKNINYTPKVFKELDLPNIICKYRKWEGHHKTILTNRELYFSSPSRFLDNDPVDCRIPIRYDLLTRKEKHYWLFNMFKKHRPEANENHIFKHTLKISKDPLTKEFCNKWNNVFYNDINAQIGILSLTIKDDDFLMWNTYADKHSGICVRYKKKMLEFMGGGGYCNYYHDKQEPIIKPVEENIVQFTKQTFYKRKKYEFEQEYRVLSLQFKGIDDGQRKFIIPPECFDSIIIGANMPEENIHEIKEIAKKSLTNIPLMKASIVNGNKLDFAPLN